MDPNSIFDPQTFLGGEVADAMATKYEPIPPGVYNGIIEKVAARHLDGTEKRPEGSVVFDVTWILDNPELAAKLNRQQLTVRQSIFLDRTPAGQLDLGPNKNVQLGKLRDAVGQNVPGQAWAPMRLQGAGPCKVEVINEPDKQDAAKIYERVKSVTKMS